MRHALNLRQELAAGLAGQNIDLVPIFDCLASGQPEVGEDQVQSVLCECGMSLFSCRDMSKFCGFNRWKELDVRFSLVCLARLTLSWCWNGEI